MNALDTKVDGISVTNPEFIEYLLRRRIDYWTILARSEHKDVRIDAREMIGLVKAELRAIRIAKALADPK
jgi:hypothetical protein